MSVLGRDITNIRYGYSRSQLYPLHYQLYSPAYINVPGMKHCLLYSFKKALPYLPPFTTGRSIYENNTLSLTVVTGCFKQDVYIQVHTKYQQINSNLTYKYLSIVKGTFYSWAVKSDIFRGTKFVRQYINAHKALKGRKLFNFCWTLVFMDSLL